LPQHRGLILIDAASAENAEVHADVVRAGRFSAVWQSPRGESFIDGVTAIVCDGADARRETLDRVAQLSRQFAPAPVIAAINFPRAGDIAQILAAGAAAVIAKPFTLHEILAQLGDALQRDVTRRTAAA
jgi:CheY-like chemotaxis protein